MSSRADERIKRSVLFAFVAVSTLQIGDEDGEFIGKSAASKNKIIEKIIDLSGSASKVAERWSNSTVNITSPITVNIYYFTLFRVCLKPRI